jgi:hypothetical protein
MQDVLSLVCFTLAGALLIWTLFRGRATDPQSRHALVASHMRSLESKWNGLL